MKRIIINEALIFLRQKFMYNDIGEEQSGLFLSENVPENDLLMEDYYNQIRKLPHDLRTVFNLYAIDGYTHKEIAIQLNIKESSSRVYLTRARNILKKYLSKIETGNGE